MIALTPPLISRAVRKSNFAVRRHCHASMEGDDAIGGEAANGSALLLASAISIALCGRSPLCDLA
jgi:hypothetical protein